MALGIKKIWFLPERPNGLDKDQDQDGWEQSIKGDDMEDQKRGNSGSLR